MRELNECKAEVFRRSEKRIKERKRKRNQILALCIPLCLIITIWSVTILPAMLPAGMDNASNESMNQPFEGTADADGAVGSAGESRPHNIISVTVKDEDYIGEITNDVSIDAIFQHISEIRATNDEYKDSADMQAPEDGFGHKENTSGTSKVGIVITMISADGIKHIYVLDGLTLYDNELDKAYVLTKAQWNDLMVALELADY